MRIEIRNDSVVLDGYVNVVDRESKPIPSVKGKFIEKIKPGAFQRSLEKRANVDLLLNHDKNRKLGSTSEGNLELFEDNIGLRAICTVTDLDVIDKAKNKELRGWSFGFYAEKDKLESVTINGNNISCEGLFIYIGLDPNIDYLKNLNLENDKGYIVVDKDMKTSLEGIYACGKSAGEAGAASKWGE